MGAVRMRVQTADKNITIIHSTPVHQLTSGEDKNQAKTALNKYVTLLWTHMRPWSTEAVIFQPEVMF